jgi:1-acyl-sn-glycerol-3-phosphate acyltransferase
VITYSRVAHSVFEVAFMPWMRRLVRGPVVSGLPAGVPAHLPLLLAANHTSWWDGFLLRSLQRRLRPHASLFTVMLESELRRRPFFRLMGVVGIDPDSPASIRKLLRFVHSRRKEEDDFVFSFFPQGRIRPSTVRPLEFRPGIGAVARALAPVAILPVGIHFEMLEHPSPTAFLRCGPLFTSEDGGLDIASLSNAVEFQIDSIRRQLEVRA